MTHVHVFACFRPKPGNGPAVLHALLEVSGATRQEPGCLSHQVFAATGDPVLYHIHGVFEDGGEFVAHTRQPHTKHFVRLIERLIDHPLKVTRAVLCSPCGEKVVGGA